MTVCMVLSRSLLCDCVHDDVQSYTKVPKSYTKVPKSYTKVPKFYTKVPKS